MTYAEAMARVAKGFKVRRPHWTARAWLVPHYEAIASSTTAIPFWDHGSKYFPCADEMEATDWISQ